VIGKKLLAGCLLRTTAFIRALRRFLKRRLQCAAEVEVTLQMLSDNAFDPRLKTHKLSGDLEGVWACSAGHNLRILFETEKVETEKVSGTFYPQHPSARYAKMVPDPFPILETKEPPP
jgi:mRNA interferase YafQ